MMGWQWHQLDQMRIICTSLWTDNHASTSSLKFLQAGCPSCHPTNSIKALKAQSAHNCMHEKQITLNSLIISILTVKIISHM